MYVHSFNVADMMQFVVPRHAADSGVRTEQFIHVPGWRDNEWIRDFKRDMDRRNLTDRLLELAYVHSRLGRSTEIVILETSDLRQNPRRRVHPAKR